MKIHQKLLLVIVGMTFLVGFMGYFSISENVRIIEKIVQVTKSSINQVKASTEMFNAAQAMQTANQKLVFERYRQTLDPAAGTNTGEIRKSITLYLDKFEHNLAVSLKANETAIRLARRNHLEEIRQSEEENKVLLGELSDEFTRHRALVNRLTRLAATDTKAAVAFLDTEVETHFESKLFPLIRRYNTESERKQVNQILQIEQDLSSANDLLFMSTVACLVVAMLLGIFVARSISRPIIRLKDAALEVGKGELQTRIAVHSRDEIGILANAFNQMVSDLSKTTVSKAYVDNILQSMGDPLIVLDRRALILRVNQATLSLLGYEEDELIGRHIRMIFPEGDIVESGIDQLIDDGVIANIEKYIKAADGRLIPVFFSFSVMAAPDGQPSGIVCVAKDITERKRSEEALHRAHDELELRVRQRTAELARANEALEGEVAVRKQAEEKIRASLQEKEVLLKEIHHRVKNNLQVISSLLFLNARKVRDKRTSDLFSDSQHRIRSMALIHEKLYQSADLARIRFQEYVRNLTHYLLRSYGAGAAPIDLQIDVEDVALEIDTAIPLGLIINELVSNAFKHAFPDGRGGVIRIGLHSDNDNHYVLDICDNGVGFPRDVDFRQTDSLGMQLVNNLVSQLGGAIELTNGNGSEFRVTFSPITKT